MTYTQFACLLNARSRNTPAATIALALSVLATLSQTREAQAQSTTKSAPSASPAAEPAQTDSGATMGATPAAGHKDSSVDKPQEETIEVVGRRHQPGKSATFTDTKWIELPQSVQSVDSRHLQDWGIVNANDAWKLTSGVFPSDQNLQSRYGSLARIRGVQGSQTLLNGFTMPQRMSLYYDMVSIGTIDFLKGPVDTLDGTQTPSLTYGGFGGQVNLRSREPTERPGLSASLAGRTLGDDRLRLTANGNHPIAAGSLLARLDGAGQLGHKFYVPSDYPLEWNYSVAPGLLWKANRDVTVQVRTAWMQNQGFAYKGIPIIYGKRLGAYDAYLGTKDSKYDFSAGMAQLEAEGRINKYLTAHAALSYMVQTLDYSIWAWGTSRTFGFEQMYQTNTGLPSYGTSDTWGKAYGFRTFLLGKADTSWWKHQGLAGVDLERMEASTTSSPWTVPQTPVSIDNPVLPAPQAGSGTSTTGPGAGGKSEYHTVRTGAFAQYLGTLGPHVRLLLGARADQHQYSDETNRKTYDKTEPGWRAGLSFLPWQILAVYTNLTEAKSPNFGLLDASGQSITDSMKFRQVEFGVKARVLRSLALSSTYFRISVDKMPVALAAQAGTTTAAYQLTGKSTYDGVEWTAQGFLLPSWDVMASYTFVHLDSNQTGANHNLSPMTFQGLTSYRLPGLFSRLRIGGSYRYGSQRFIGYGPGGVDPRNSLPAYGVVDGLVEVRLPEQVVAARRWLVLLNVDNILNAKYYTTARQISEVGAGEPRAVMLTTRVDY